MSSSCCYSCLKSMVFIVSLVVMLVGLGVTGLAVWLLVSDHLYLSTSLEDFSFVTGAALSADISFSFPGLLWSHHTLQVLAWVICHLPACAFGWGGVCSSPAIFQRA
eukprot:TRINITY_DN21768_c0_g1_i1.p1 TRINITY_DN21768_c0_g1~~TRINITY_DN21768_c0_g1_i1.p1  ORF type:complete len:107 (-),score=14.13 TRINITY_DN21768_c0_g1_i1:40-360(-)